MGFNHRHPETQWYSSSSTMDQLYSGRGDSRIEPFGTRYLLLIWIEGIQRLYSKITMVRSHLTSMSIWFRMDLLWKLQSWKKMPVFLSPRNSLDIVMIRMNLSCSPLLLSTGRKWYVDLSGVWPDVTFSPFWQQAFMIDFYVDDPNNRLPVPENIGFSYILPSNLRGTSGSCTMPITGKKHLPIGQLSGN